VEIHQQFLRSNLCFLKVLQPTAVG